MPHAVLIGYKNDDQHNHNVQKRSHRSDSTMYYTLLNIHVYTIYNNKVSYQENMKQ